MRMLKQHLSRRLKRSLTLRLTRHMGAIILLDVGVEDLDCSRDLFWTEEISYGVGSVQDERGVPGGVRGVEITEEISQSAHVKRSLHKQTRPQSRVRAKSQSWRAVAPIKRSRLILSLCHAFAADKTEIGALFLLLLPKTFSLLPCLSLSLALSCTLSSSLSNLHLSPFLKALVFTCIGKANPRT